MAKINTKILSFGDVQKSLQEIEKELNFLSKSVNSPAETNIEDSQGKTGDVKIIKNPDKTYTFKVRSAEGWQSPIFDHDSMTNFVSNEHIDWTTDQGSTNIHTGNYVAGGTSEFTLAADTGSSQTISNTNTLTIEGGEGIDTVAGATDKVTISGVDASTSNKGIAIFSSNNFDVSSGTVTIKDEGVALAELAHMATDSFLGRTTSSTGDVEVLSKSDALTILNVADGAEANVSGDSGNSAIYDNSGTPTLKSGITQGEMQTAIGGVYTDTTYSVMASGNSYAAGLVAAGSGTHGNQFLRKDGTWVVPTDTDTNTNQLTTFVVEDGDGTEVTISQDKEWKFVEGTGIDIDWTDTSNGSDADPYDLTITCNLEGTELASTGETGGTKFLREDGDGTCSWQTVSSGASALNDVSDVTY